MCGVHHKNVRGASSCCGKSIKVVQSNNIYKRMLIMTRSVKSMPVFLSFFLFVNAGVSFTFAMLLHDYFVLVPNAVGIVLGSFQLIQYFVYMNKSSSSKSIETLEEVEEEVADELKNVEMKQDVEGGRF